ncbi:MAG: UDP-N-acetylmuramoyl-L-alanine--D-glutamate ligase [Bacteroidales bacterium]|nr:UDP-N-acetylmuramoyl-L-alanine--D-glutamate ligase [Bacteroidales bacterium]MCB9012991.1 UDP-N-acetylmuramoyl-L-alanine--D-glutamate ligase [Bacteroidales bacterium]
MEITRRIAILGAGESGTGAAVLAKKQGFDVFVSDSNKIKPRYIEILDQHMIPYEEERHTEKLILNADEVIKSPGIAESTPLVIQLRKKGIKIISDIEFAARYTSAKKICITGSNGKTTTASLIHHMMRKAGLNAGMAGNIGKSFAYQVATEEYDYYVLELSSFQLDGMYEFKADIAILLNITPDHLDRYDYNLQNYVDSKFRITQNLTEDQYFLFCSDDEITIKELEKIVTKAQQLPFAYYKHPDDVAWVEEEKFLRIEFDDVDFSMSLQELSLKGRHNTYNSMAAGIAGSVLKIRKEIIRESLMDFQGVEHRLESVVKVHGIEFINDSKATNVNSSWYALESMHNPVIWIAGGVDKGNDYESLKALVQDKVKVLICLGKDNKKLHKAFEGLVDEIIDTDNMKDAVRKAYHHGTDGDVVLLSPCCASFDLFENYEQRGRFFKEAVREL